MLGSHLTVYYEITTECPCNCSMCYIPEALRHDHPLTRNSADVMLDLLILKEKLNVENVVLSGGEPTLHSDFKEIVSFASRLGLKVAVISNGAKPEILKEVSGQAKIWISLDFFGEAQDKWRHFRGLWRNYKSIADIANIRATLLQNNLEHVKKLIVEATSRNKEITIVPYKGSTPKLMPTPEQLEKLLIYIFNEGYAKKAVVDAPSVRMFLATKNPELKNEAQKNSLCPACNTIIRLDTEGYIHPCLFLNQKICEITDPEIKQKIAEARKATLQTYTGKCETCQYKTLCGGCKASLNTECFL